jgi:sulfite reductase alpha subunit-like flavoprotein
MTRTPFFIVASSSGRGDIPTDGLTFFRQLLQHTDYRLPTAGFAIFGNGNSTYGPVDYNGAARKLEKALVSNDMKQVISLYQGDVFRENPPLGQFDEWWQSILRLLTAEDMLGPPPENHGPVQAVEQDVAHDIEFSSITRAKFVSVDGTGLKRITLDVGSAGSTGMSHVHISIPFRPTS